MNKIVNALKKGKAFSGKNGAFTGTRWHEDWELQHVIWGFERGDYFFL